MEKRKKTIALTTVLIKKRQSFKRKLKLLILQWLNSVHIINAMASYQMQLFQQIAVIDEESTSRERRWWKINRDGKFWESDVPRMDEEMFRNNFRVHRSSFDKICSIVKDMAKQDTNMRACIPLDKRVAIALYSLGSSAEYRTISNLFGVGRSTVGEIMLDFCQAVSKNFKTISSYPPSPEEVNTIVSGFKELGFPQCYGALDGCHIEVQPEKENAVDYYNYKGWYSIVLLASCDHRSKFTYINIGSTGKNNDSYIFERSSLKKFHEFDKLFVENSVLIDNVNVPVLLIGDSAFRLSKYMMKPYPFKADQPPIEKTFNYHLSKCRRVIENAFGQLKARFRRIGKGLEVAPRNCNVVVNACCLLHNFLKDEQDEIASIWLEEVQNLSKRIQPVSTTVIGNNDVDGRTIRNAIANSFEYSADESRSEDVGFGI